MAQGGRERELKSFDEPLYPAHALRMGIHDHLGKTLGGTPPQRPFASSRVNHKALASAIVALGLLVLDRLIVPQGESGGIRFAIGFVILTVAFAPGIALGVLALREIRRTGERGKTLALIGITAPSAYLALSLLFWIGLR